MTITRRSPRLNGVRSFFSHLLLISLCAVTALAQTETGQINGTILDPGGAVVPGANVTVRSTDTGVERAATTDDTGNYTVTNLQPGVYEVTAQAASFAPLTQRVQVTVGGRPTLDFNLAVTARTETVEVVGSGGVEVNTQNQELSDVVSSNQIRDLPTITRDPYDLVTLSGNVSGAAESGQGRGTGFAINGQRAASTNILLDGAENVDTFAATVGQSIPLEAVQEFRIITSNFSAEYGRASGGIVSLTTRAGTNDFNGSLFAFNRISRLSSNGFENNANGVERGVFTRNQFGYAVGGPIKRDKLFFFSSTEFTRVRSTGDLLAVVPTPQLIAASAAPTRNFFDTFGTLAATPTGRVFTVADISAERELAGGGAFTSLPASLPAFQLVRYTVPTDLGAGFPLNSYSTVNRIDYNLSDRTQVYGRFAIEDQDIFEGFNSASPFAGFNTGETNFNQNYLVSLTRTLTPNFVAQTKLAYNRLNNLSPLGDTGASPTLYLFPQTSGTIGNQSVALPGILPFTPGAALPFGGPQNVGQINQDFNLVKGRNAFRFGGQYVYIQDNRTFGAFNTAVETLGGQGNYGQALDNFVLGRLFQFQGAVDPQGQFPGGRVSTPVGQPSFTRNFRYNEFALYFNDALRVHSRVTVNLGLRYEFYGVQRNKDQDLDSNFYPGSGSDQFEQIRNGQVLLTRDSSVGKFYKNDLNNFAPRLGVAWDVTGDGRTSLRGGFGVSYERNFGNVTFNVIQNPPNYAVLSVTAGQDIPQEQLPIFTSNAGPLAGSGVSRVLPVTSLRNLDPNLTNAYAYFYSAALERELFRSTVASIEYSGSAGRSLYTLENINRFGSGLRYLGTPTTTPTGGASTRLNGQYSNLNTRGNNGRSNYNALIASLDSGDFRGSGLTFTARYTLARAKDNLSSTFSEGANNFNLGLLDPFDPDLDYGNADFDIRHRFSGSFSYELPFFKNSGGLARKLLGGFQFTGIVTARTGAPFTVFDCTNGLTTCIRLVPTGAFETRGLDNIPAAGVNRFNYVNLGNQRPSDFTDVSGFTEVGPYPANMTRRNLFRAPGFYNIDAGLYKNVGLTENTSLQLRLEAFNVLNHSNLYVSSGEADISSIDFVPARRGVTPGGGVTDRRNVQLAVKFLF